MSDESTTTETTNDEGAETQATGFDAFPAEAQEMIRALRKESAGHRTAKREFEAQLASAKEELEAKTSELTELQSNYEAAIAKHTDTETELGKLRVALDAEVPVEVVATLASHLKGSSAEEWKESAQSLKSLMAPVKERAVDHSQGMGGAEPLNSPNFEARLRGILGA